MKLIAAIILAAGAALAQDATTPPPALKDADLALLGAFAAERIDAAPTGDALEESLASKLKDLREGKSAPDGASSTPAKGKKKKKAARKPAAPSVDTIKNGLTESDRVILGKLAVSSLEAGHKGEQLSGELQKELDRLRSERVKASSQADAAPKKKKKKSA